MVYRTFGKIGTKTDIVLTQPAGIDSDSWVDAEVQNDALSLQIQRVTSSDIQLLVELIVV